LNHGWSDVKVRVIKDAKHYVAAGQPRAVAELIEHHIAESN
jgi:hypothetical protein